LAYFLHYGNLPEGMMVCHTCDNPPCCNPSHLFLGTHSDNMQDSVRKKRSKNVKNLPAPMPGETHPNHILTAEQVIEIRKLISDGMTHKKIARLFSIGRSTVTGINSGRLWAYLTTPQGLP
jgi:hypothetical protein